MPRLFNVEVFNQTIGSGRSYYTGEEFYGLLDSADTLLVQSFVESVSQGSTAVSVQYQTSNVQQEWTWADGTETVTVATLADAPKIGLLQLPHPDDGLGAFGRLKISTNETGASVRIVVCGRSN